MDTNLYLNTYFSFKDTQNAHRQFRLLLDLEWELFSLRWYNLHPFSAHNAGSSQSSFPVLLLYDGSGVHYSASWTPEPSASYPASLYKLNKVIETSEFDLGIAKRGLFCISLLLSTVNSGALCECEYLFCFFIPAAHSLNNVRSLETGTIFFTQLYIFTYLTYKDWFTDWTY